MTNLILKLVFDIMPKDKKSKIDDINKLRQILDAPYDFKSSSSEDSESLGSIRKRLTGEASKTEDKQSKTTPLSSTYAGMEPRVTVYPKKEERVQSVPEKVEIKKTPEDIQKKADEEDIFSDEDLYEIEKVTISEPEFLEVKSEEISEQDIDAEEGNKTLPEWESVDEPTQKENLEHQKEDSKEHLPEFEKIEEATDVQPSIVEKEDEIPTWEPVVEEGTKEKSQIQPDTSSDEKTIGDGTEQSPKEKKDASEAPTIEKDVVKERILSTLPEHKPKKRIKEDKKRIKESKESILKKIISKKSKESTLEPSMATQNLEIEEQQPSTDKVDKKPEEILQLQQPSAEDDTDIPTWEPISDERVGEGGIEPEIIKDETRDVDETEIKISEREKETKTKKKQKEEKRLKKIKEKEAKITKKEKKAESKRKKKAQKIQKKEEQRLKRQKAKQQLKEKQEPLQQITSQPETTPETEELSEWESYDVDEEASQKDHHADVPYKYGEFTLYKKEITTSTGKIRNIHFFSKKKPDKGEAVVFPEGYEVKINKVTKLPYLRRKK
jgi:hypothetical protein